MALKRLEKKSETLLNYQYLLLVWQQKHYVFLIIVVGILSNPRKDFDAISSGVCKFYLLLLDLLGEVWGGGRGNVQVR